MTFAITFSNYRCYSRASPLKLRLHPGFTSYIGKNDAGKTTAMKALYEFRNAFTACHQRFLSTHGSNLLSWNPPNGQPAAVDIATRGQDDSVEITIDFDKPHSVQHHEYIGRLSLTVDKDNRKANISALLENSKHNIHSIIYGTDGWLSESSNHPRAYAKHVMDALNILSNVLYIPTVRHAEPHGSNQTYDMWLGRKVSLAWEQWLKGGDRSKLSNAIRLAREIGILLGYSNFTIRGENQHHQLQIEIDGQVYTLDELGAGASQIISTLTFLAEKRPSYLLIDEPEIGMHPALQVDFMRTLIKYVEYGVLFTTHSIGLARTISDHIYVVKSDFSATAGRNVKIDLYKGAQSILEFLGSMSYSSYLALGYDTLLLVEGPSDALMFQQWLRLYKKEHRVVCMPLGGSSTIHGGSEPIIAELRRLCPKIVIVVDSDREVKDGEPGRVPKQFSELCKQLGVPCHLTERPSTDHYLTTESLKTLSGAQYQALPPYTKQTVPWKKMEAWRAAAHMVRRDLEDTDLHKLLDSL